MNLKLYESYVTEKYGNLYIMAESMCPKVVIQVDTEELAKGGVDKGISSFSENR